MTPIAASRPMGFSSIRRESQEARRRKLVQKTMDSPKMQQRLVQRFLRSGFLHEQATAILSDFIVKVALKVAIKYGRRNPEDFADSMPAEVLFPMREYTDKDRPATRRIDGYDFEQPFRPWLTIVIRNYLITEYKRGKKESGQSELLNDMADGSGMPDEPIRFELAATLCKQMESATTRQGLVVFLAVTGLHSMFADWQGLLQRYQSEPLKPKQTPRRPFHQPFPSARLDEKRTARTRTTLVAQELGLKSNTVSQAFLRAKKDLKKVVPNLIALYETARHSDVSPSVGEFE